MKILSTDINTLRENLIHNQEKYMVFGTCIDSMWLCFCYVRVPKPNTIKFESGQGHHVGGKISKAKCTKPPEHGIGEHVAICFLKLQWHDPSKEQLGTI